MQNTDDLYLSHAAPEGLAVGVNVHGILLHEAEVSEGPGGVGLVDGRLGLALHLHQLSLGLREEGLASPVLCESGRTHFPDPAVRLFSVSGS